jgi:hypothetical protein
MTFTLTWDLTKIADALELTAHDATNYFKDGRRGGFLLEGRVTSAMQGTKAPSEKCPYDFTDAEDRKWEVRSLTKHVFFCPSGMVGQSRSFDEAGFRDKLDTIHGYVICDLTQFPAVPCWKVTAETIGELYDAGALGRDTKITRTTFFDVVVPRLAQ